MQLLRRPLLPRRKQAPCDLIPELSDNPGRGRGSPRPRSWAGSAVHLPGFSLAQCAGVQRNTNQNQNQKHAPKEPLASMKWRWSTPSAGAWRCGGRVLMPRARQEDSEGPQSAREPFLSGFSGREHPELWLKGLVGSPAPCELPRLPVSPGFSRRKMGCPAGVGRAGPRDRVVTCPPSPPLLREFQSERARGLLLGRNHPARLRRVGRRHLTARPRPPRVRGGGSVCSVTNGPSRPARPLAPARRGPARARSSRRLRRPAAQRGPGRRSPPPLRVLPTPSAEASRRRSLREARPRWRAALLSAGECAVRAWDAAGTFGGTCGSSDADADPCDAQVKFARNSEDSVHLGLLWLLQRVGVSR